MKRLLVWIAVVSLAGGWEVTFDPHPNNVALTTVISCFEAGGAGWWALNRREIEPSDTRVFVRMPDVPYDVNCEVIFYRMVNTTDDPDNEVAAEQKSVWFTRD